MKYITKFKKQIISEVNKNERATWCNIHDIRTDKKCNSDMKCKECIVDSIEWLDRSVENDKK